MFSSITANTTAPLKSSLPNEIEYGVSTNASFFSNLTVGVYEAYGFGVADRFVNNITQHCDTTSYSILKVEDYKTRA